MWHNTENVLKVHLNSATARENTAGSSEPTHPAVLDIPQCVHPCPDRNLFPEGSVFPLETRLH